MIGILGGTFDPIHYGHLRPAQDAMRALGLREIRVIPAGVPPHGKIPVATPAQRFEMARLACDEFPGCVADDREVRRPGPSYTVDTLRSLRDEIGNAVPMCLLLGIDAFLALETWNRWMQIPDLAHIVVMQRPGASFADSRLSTQWAMPRMSVLPSDLARQPAGRLLFLPVTPLDVSSTQLRVALAKNEAVSALVPAAVAEFIRNHDLYSVTGD